MNFSTYTRTLTEDDIIAMANGIGVTISRNRAGFKITPHKTDTHDFAQLPWATSEVAIGQKCAWFPASTDGKQTAGWNTPVASYQQQSAAVTTAPKDTKQEAVQAAKANAAATLNQQ